MASRHVLLMTVLIAFVVPILGAHYMVGEAAGWTFGVDYSAWAQGKDFRVGDVLVFKYNVGAHNVVEVNGTQYERCSASLGAIPFTSGSDEIHLSSPGETGFICTFGSHCSSGMKLLINVSSSAADAPLPAHGSTSSSSSSGPLIKSFVSSMIPVMAACVMI